MWFYALDGPIDADIRVTNMDILDSTLPAIQFVGKPIRRVVFSDVRIDGAHHLLQLQSAGEADVSRLSARRVTAGGIARCHDGFQLTLLDDAKALSDLPAVPCDAITGARAEAAVP